MVRMNGFVLGTGGSYPCRRSSSESVLTSSREPADSVSDSESESDDGEGDREGPRDRLAPGADPSTMSRVGDGERDRIWASGGARTTSAGGIYGVTGHRESEPTGRRRRGHTTRAWWRASRGPPSWQPTGRRRRGLCEATRKWFCAMQGQKYGEARWLW